VPEFVFDQRLGLVGPRTCGAVLVEPSSTGSTGALFLHVPKTVMLILLSSRSTTAHPPWARFPTTFPALASQSNTPGWSRHRLWWLIVLPGTVDRFCEAIIASGVTPKGIKRIGALADLVPPQQIAQITTLLQAPFANTFGATETGLPPASAGLLSIGQIPASLAKTVNALCEIRLVDADDHDVLEGEAGELVIRGPTLFSGYWNAPQATAHEFRGGWFHMGDVFRRHLTGP